MTSDPVATCSCCGAELPDTGQIDVRFGLPDAAWDTPEEAHRKVNAGLLQVNGHGSFARCLLPVTLSSGTALVLGTWMRITDADLERAHALWDAPEYNDLTLTGTLANAINPWGDELLGAPLTAVVRNETEIPYVDTSSHALLAHVLHATWDRDEVLSCFGDPLPVPVRTMLSEQWTIERTAGMAARVVDGTSRFSSANRAVYADLLVFPPTTSHRDFLASMIEGAPAVGPDEQLTEEHADGGLRHAFWVTSRTEEGPRHAFYGFAVHDGTAVALGCMFDNDQDLSWAQHVWRSIGYTRAGR